jgi:hypothetical protein
MSRNVLSLSLCVLPSSSVAAAATVASPGSSCCLCLSCCCCLPRCSPLKEEEEAGWHSNSTLCSSMSTALHCCCAILSYCARSLEWQKGKQREKLACLLALCSCCSCSLPFFLPEFIDDAQNSGRKKGDRRRQTDRLGDTQRQHSAAVLYSPKMAQNTGKRDLSG